MSIFLDDRDYREFVYLLGETVDRYNIQCWNYCAMPNHYHLTLKPRLPNLSEAMQYLNGEYAKWWNARHKHVGHAYQGRFKDPIVGEPDYLLSLTRYVLMNPVRAGLVEHPEDWPWSSYSATAGLSSCPAFLDVTATLGLFGPGDTGTCRGRFAAFVTSTPDDPSFEDRIRSNEQIHGSAEFKTSINELIRDDAGTSDGSSPTSDRKVESV